MKILGLTRADASSEAGEIGSPELFEAMGKLMEEVTAAGVMIASDGLKPTSFGKRVKYENGKSTIVDGPFTESKELVASYALFKVGDWDETSMRRESGSRRSRSSTWVPLSRRP